MMDISDLQIVCFEIGSECNLSHLHKACPANLGDARYAALDRSRPLDDKTILDMVAEFYRRGFTGFVAWHYYNEPLLCRERMASLMARIRKAQPAARFLLWTNGTLIPPDPTALPEFDVIRITNYGGANPPVNLNCARASCKRIAMQTAHLDGRRQGLAEKESDAPCQRPYTELIVDCFANVHLCCIDWRGLASPGNIMRDGLETCIDRWRDSANKIVGKRMAADAPDACRRCPMRFASRSNFT